MPSNHLILCHPHLLLPSNFPSIRVFSNESTLHMRWPKYCSFSFNISPPNGHPGLISLRMDWLDFLEVQGTLKSLLQHHSSKASILQHSAFFIVQLSHPHMTTGKTIALTRGPMCFNLLWGWERWLCHYMLFLWSDFHSKYKDKSMIFSWWLLRKIHSTNSGLHNLKFPIYLWHLTSQILFVHPNIGESSEYKFDQMVSLS